MLSVAVGSWMRTQPAKMDRDVADLMERRRMTVYVIEEDLAQRGIENVELLSGVKLLLRAALPGLCEAHAVVSLW